MLLGKLGRQKIAIIIKGNIEKPSDLDGVLYIPYNEKIIEIGMKLITKLRESGIGIDDKDASAALSD